MNHNIIRRVVTDIQTDIQTVELLRRNIVLEDSANYILTGVRRAGKSMILYQRALDLIREGADWNQIFYVNFEDDRLAEFTKEDFDDLAECAHEMTDRKIFWFFDEIQIVENWQKFARRLADQHERVYITGSNSKMLSAEMASQLGGRYLTVNVMPFSFTEVLDYKGIPYDLRALSGSASAGVLRREAHEYMQYGGLPESLHFNNKRTYIHNVFDKVILGDIVMRYQIKNPFALRLLIKKIAETVMREVSYNKLANSIKSTGTRFSTDSAILYANYAEDANLLFRTENYFTGFSKKGRLSRFYFIDNGFLSLFLINKDSALLENIVADQLHRCFGNNIYYLKSAVTGIDADFFVPQIRTVIQVTYSLNEESSEREVSSLIRLAKTFSEADRYMIVTYEEEKEIQTDNTVIMVMPLYKFLITSLGG